MSSTDPKPYQFVFDNAALDSGRRWLALLHNEKFIVLINLTNTVRFSNSPRCGRSSPGRITNP